LSLDVVIRGVGTIRSPSEHVAAVESDASRILITTAESPDPETLIQELDANPEEPLLVYGDESLLPLLGTRPVATLWLVVGPGENPLRGVWRLRGGFPWIADVNLALILEEQAAGEAVAASQLLKTGRIARVVTLPPAVEPLAEVAAAQMEEAVPVPVADESVAEAPLAEEGVSAEMSVYPYVPAAAAMMETTERNTEQALISRYALVKERRSLVPKMAQTEEILTNLLKEVFVTRYTTGPEAAGVFVDLTGKLAQTAHEYKEMAEALAKVEKQLEELAWLKNELDM
jgi:hypothetical protein